MIADISIGAFVKGLIDYHEKKVDENKADRIYNNTLGLTDREELIYDFLKTVEQNPKEMKNKVAHFSLSFPEGENPSSEKMTEIGEQYLKQMGYDNRPTLMYRHDDTSKAHFHILVPTCDNKGVKTKEYNNFKKSQEISRQIEKDFGLKKTEYKKEKSTKLSEINFSNYRLNKSFNTISFKADPYVNTSIKNKIGEDNFTAITETTMSNNEIKNLVGNDNFNFINNELRKKDLLQYTNKEKIYLKLDQALLSSKSPTDFESNVKESGLYIREVKSKKHFSYGITQNGKTDYYRDYNISQRFTREGIQQHFGKKHSFEDKQTKTFLKGNISRLYKQSKSWDEFAQFLKNKGIGFKFNGSPKPSGVSFFSEKSPDLLFKGSDIKRDFSFSNLNRYFALNEFSKEDPFPKTKESFSTEQKTSKDTTSKKPFIPDGSNAPSEDERKEEFLRKKRNNDKGQSLN